MILIPLVHLHQENVVKLRGERDCLSGKETWKEELPGCNEDDW